MGKHSLNFDLRHVQNWMKFARPEREKKFCENAGFDEKEYLKHRDLDRKQQAMRKGDGRYER